jgi:excinuclease ABC subunit A
VPHCPICGKKIEKQTIDQIVDQILELEQGTKIQILSPVIRGKKGEYTKLIADLLKDGFIRAKIDGKIFELTDEIKLDKNKKHDIDLIVDRLIIKKDIQSRLTESIEIALKYSANLVNIDVSGKEEILYSQNYSCPDCSISFEELSPRMFSFNTPFGACPKCMGLGFLLKIDEDLIIPDKNKTLYDGVKAFGASAMKTNDTMAKMYFESIAEKYKVNIDVPIKKLPKEFLNKILYGTGDEKFTFEYISYSGKRTFESTFEGIIPTIERRYNQTQSQGMKDFYMMYMSNSPCPDCGGTRLRKESLAVKVGNKNIKEITDMSIIKTKEFFNNLKLNKTQELIAESILNELNKRLQFLIDVGLEYLTLSRPSRNIITEENHRG